MEMSGRVRVLASPDRYRAGGLAGALFGLLLAGSPSWVPCHRLGLSA